MITVKGFRYYDDYMKPQFKHAFPSLTEFEKWIQNTNINKKRIHLPPQDAKGDFEQQWASTFSGHLSFPDEDGGQRPDVSCHICLIEKDGAILFSSGTYTDDKGHISSEMKESLSRLKSYINADYNFAP